MNRSISFAYRITFLLGIILCSLSQFVCNAQLPSYLPTNGLVAWYPFNGNANDESGNGYNGVVNGAIMANDRFGNTNSAYQFNNNFIRIPYNANLSPTSGSVSIWLKVNGLFNQGQQLLFAQSDGRPSTYVNSQFRCGQLKSAGNSWRTTASGGTSDYATVCAETILDDGQWHQIVGTYTPSSLKIYVDGILESSTTTSLIQNPSIFKDFYIGGFGPADGGFQYFNGTLDDLIVYNRPLTPTEVTALYTSTSTNSGGGNTTTTAPPGIPYQAEVRNDSGEVLANANVNVRFTLHELTANGAVSYQETHAITTNELGLFAATIGAGTATQGTFASINWAQTTKFLQVEVDTGNGYITMGNQQLMSVPYALYAANGPQGPQGPVGPQGPAGERGPQGDSGSNNGYIHYIGEYYSGGYIFSLWKDSFDVEHGLIVSPFNAGVATYQTYYNNDAGPNSLNLYSGIENTYAILNNDISMPNPGGFTNAAYLCDTYTNDGYTDWYLPSIKELEELGRSNLIIYQASNGVSHLAAAGGIIQFWSSTQFSNSESYAYTVLGGITTSWKANNNLVRPIRKF